MEIKVGDRVGHKGSVVYGRCEILLITTEYVVVNVNRANDGRVRFICINFERGAISAYVAISGNQPLRVATIGGQEYNLRDMNFDEEHLQSFRLHPTTFGVEPPSLYPGGIDDIPFDVA